MNLLRALFATYLVAPDLGLIINPWGWDAKRSRITIRESCCQIIILYKRCKNCKIMNYSESKKGHSVESRHLLFFLKRTYLKLSLFLNAFMWFKSFWVWLKVHLPKFIYLHWSSTYWCFVQIRLGIFILRIIICLKKKS